MTTDALFKHIELLQGKKPWGRLLDAGTGSASLRWITGLDTQSWTAITADPQRARRVESEFSASRREGDRVVVTRVDGATVEVAPEERNDPS